MFDNQLLVSQLLELEAKDPNLDVKDEIKVLIEKDLGSAVEKSVERFKKGDGRLAKLAKDESFVEGLRKHYEQKYDELVGRQKSRTNADEADQPSPRQILAETKSQQRRETLREEIAVSAEDKLTRLDNLVDDAYGAILTYSEGYLGGNTSPFETEFIRFTGARPQTLRDNVPTEHIRIRFSDAALEGAVPGAGNAILRTPLGSFLRFGELRSGIVVLDDESVADLKQGGATRERPAFVEAISGSVLAAVNAAANRPLIARRLSGWLQHDGDIAINEAELRELENYPNWVAAAAVSRTALLLLQSWSRRLESFRRWLDIPADNLKARIARHRRAAPADADRVVKVIEDSCKQELRAVVAGQTKRFESAIEQSRIACEEVLESLSIGADIVTADPANRRPVKPGYERVRLDSRIPLAIERTIREKLSAVAGEGVSASGRPIFVESEDEFATTAWKRVREHIVLYWLGGAVNDPFLKTATTLRQGVESEPMVAPVPAVIADAMLDEELQRFTKRCQGDEFTAEVTNYNDIQAIYQGVGKLPVRLLASLGPIFAITTLLGFGGAAIIKNLSSNTVGGLGAFGIGVTVVAVFVLFVIGAYISLVRRQTQEKTLFALATKTRLLEMHNQLLMKLKNRYVTAANARLERSVEDVLRRIKVHFDPYWAEAHDKWRAELGSLEQSQKHFTRQSDVLAAVQKEVSRIAHEVAAVQEDLRKLAQNKILK